MLISLIRLIGYLLLFSCGHYNKLRFSMLREFTGAGYFANNCLIFATISGG